MTTNDSATLSENSQANQTDSTGRQPESMITDDVIDVARSADWMPADELRGRVLRILDEGKHLTFNLDALSHLDASALQILLAAQLESRRLGRDLHLQNVSSDLRQWFELAAAEQLFPESAENQ